jgi:hypothetical protein
LLLGAGEEPEVLETEQGQQADDTEQGQQADDTEQGQQADKLSPGAESSRVLGGSALVQAMLPVGAENRGESEASSHLQGNEALEAVVAWTKQRKQVDDEALTVLARKLDLSEGCKAKESDFQQLCEGQSEHCEADYTAVMGSSYTEVPSEDVAPRCKTLWFAGVCCFPQLYSQSQLLEQHTSFDCVLSIVDSRGHQKHELLR